MFKKLISIVPFLGMALLAGQANAVEVINLDLTNPDSKTGVKKDSNPWCWYCAPTDSPYYAMTYSYQTDGGEFNVTVSGWSYDANKRIVQDYVGNFSTDTTGGNYGLGVEAEWTPEHSIDNHYGDYDMVLLAFDQAVNLESLTAGWRSNGTQSYNISGNESNSEVSLLAFTGDESQMTGFTGKKWQDLLTKGWESGGAYGIENLNQAEEVNTAGLVSKYWLVGAYNPSISGAGFSNGNDFFKLTGATVSVNPVPLPGSLFLFGAALVGFGAIRRKRTI